MTWLRVRELVRKEFIQLFRDRKNRPMLVIAPLIQMILFGYVVTTDVRDIRVAVIDQSRTPDSRRLIDAFDANATFRVTHVLQDPEELDRMLLERRVDLGLQVAPDFSARLREGRTADVQILVDGSMSNMAAVRIAYSASVLDTFNSQLLRELNRRRIDFGEIDGRVRTWYNPNLDSQHYFVPGIVAFLVMLLSLLFTSMAVVREKEAGTMEQLIVTPLKATEFILGKTIPFILIAQAQMVMVILFARLWFRIPMAGNALVLLAASSIFLLSTLGIGLLISTHDDQFLLHSAVFHAERLRLPHRQHAGRGAMADASQSVEPFPDHHPRRLPQGHRRRRPVAAVPGAGGARRGGLRRGGAAVPEADRLAAGVCRFAVACAINRQGSEVHGSTVHGLKERVQAFRVRGSGKDRSLPVSGFRKRVLATHRR